MSVDTLALFFSFVSLILVILIRRGLATKKDVEALHQEVLAMRTEMNVERERAIKRIDAKIESEMAARGGA